MFEELELVGRRRVKNTVEIRLATVVVAHFYDALLTLEFVRTLFQTNHTACNVVLIRRNATKQICISQCAILVCDASHKARTEIQFVTNFIFQINLRMYMFFK